MEMERRIAMPTEAGQVGIIITCRSGKWACQIFVNGKYRGSFDDVSTLAELEKIIASECEKMGLR